MWNRNVINSKYVQCTNMATIPELTIVCLWIHKNTDQNKNLQICARSKSPAWKSGNRKSTDYNRLSLRKYGNTKIFYEIYQRREIIQTAVQWKKLTKIQRVDLQQNCEVSFFWLQWKQKKYIFYNRLLLRKFRNAKIFLNLINVEQLFRPPYNGKS